MGLLQILAIVGLACLGSGYAEDVYVVCDLKDTSTDYIKVFKAPADTDTLAFTEVFGYHYWSSVRSIAVDDSKGCIYFDEFYKDSVMKYCEATGTSELVIPKDSGEDYVEHVTLDEAGDTLYFCNYAGDVFKVDLTAADPSTTLQKIASPGRVLSTAIHGRYMYMTIYYQTGSAFGTRDIRKLHLDDPYEVTIVTSARNIDGLVYDAGAAEEDDALYFAWSKDNDNQVISRYDFKTNSATEVSDTYVGSNYLAAYSIALLTEAY
ncbi:uncharacterized protein [Amphiura filiformis]|uniref:uncharacterized protein n=1 Tax=Amphiura filiformis TaxID=82378 RepID=UPI003B227496